MNIPGFTAGRSVAPGSYYHAAEIAESAVAGHIQPQMKVTTPFCGACTCRTVGGCGVGPYNPGWQNCLEVDTHDSWNPLNWTLGVASVPCLGATEGKL